MMQASAGHGGEHRGTSSARVCGTEAGQRAGRGGSGGKASGRESGWPGTGSAGGGEAERDGARGGRGRRLTSASIFKFQRECSSIDIVL